MKYVQMMIIYFMLYNMDNPLPTIPILPKRIKKPNNKLGNFYTKQILVKLKTENLSTDPHAYNLDYFKECGYCDYRVTCDICEKGDACGFKTNLLDIMKDDYFPLN